MDSSGFGFYVYNGFCLLLIRVIIQNPSLKKLLIMIICIVNFAFFSYNDKISSSETKPLEDINNHETENIQEVNLTLNDEPKDQYSNFANGISGNFSSASIQSEEIEKLLSFTDKQNYDLIQISASYTYYIAIAFYIVCVIVTINQGYHLSTALHRYSIFIYLQIFCLFFQNNQMNSYYSVLLLCVEIVIHLVASRIKNVNSKYPISFIVLWLSALAINRFRNPYSTTDSLGWLLTYFALPILEYPLLCMIYLGLANNFGNFLEELMANDYYINTKNKNNKEIFFMIFYEIGHICFLLLGFGSLTYVEMVIEYIHGYRPAMVTLFSGITYSIPFAYCLEFPKDIRINSHITRDVLPLNIFPVLFSFYMIKLSFA